MASTRRRKNAALVKPTVSLLVAWCATRYHHVRDQILQTQGSPTLLRERHGHGNSTEPRQALEAPVSGSGYGSVD